MKDNEISRITRAKLFDIKEQTVEDKIVKRLEKHHGSFFEDNPNFLYEYLARLEDKELNYIQANVDNKKIFQKKQMMEHKVDEMGFKFNDVDLEIPNSKDSLRNYKKHTSNYLVLKNKIKNDRFIVRKESNRNNVKSKKNNNDKNENLNDINNEKNEKKEEFYLNMRKINNENALYGEVKNFNEKENVENFIKLNKEMIEVTNKNKEELRKRFKNLDQNKLLQTYSRKEIEDYYRYKINYDLNLKKIDKESTKKVTLNMNDRDKLLEKHRKKVNVLNNNITLFKPTVFKSKKQQHYEMAFEQQLGFNNKNNIMMINKNNFNDLQENEVKFKLENLENKIYEMENKNYNNKLDKLDYLHNEIKLGLNMNIEARNQQIKKDNYLLNQDSFRDDELHLDLGKRENRLTCCEKIHYFFLGDPTKTYSSKRRIWASNNVPFPKYFQDKRIYVDEIKNEIIGENNKTEKKD